MSQDYDKRYVEPIVNASRPGTLAGLSMSILKFSTNDPVFLQWTLIFAAIMYLLSSFFIFFYTIYPTKKMLWTGTSLTFLLGLLSSVISSILLLIDVNTLL